MNVILLLHLLFQIMIKISHADYLLIEDYREIFSVPFNLTQSYESIDIILKPSAMLSFN